jgi:hypothetical protein
MQRIRLLPDPPEQVRSRLTLLGWFLASATAGWLLARLGESLRQTPGLPWRRRLATVAAEELLFLGTAGLVVPCLIGGASLSADRPVAPVYYMIAGGAAAAAVVLLPAGGILYQRVRGDAAPGGRE